MNKFFYYLLLWTLCPYGLFAQIDTITPKWSAEEKAIFEIVEDSINIPAYMNTKDSLFKQFWETFPEKERAKIALTSDEYFNYIRKRPDTAHQEEWVNKITFYHCFSMLRFRYVQNSIKARERRRFDTIALIFWYEGKKIVLDNNFRVYVIAPYSQIIQAKTIGGSFILPKMSDTVRGVILFEYQQKQYVIYRNLLNSIRQTDSIQMIFDTKPYDRQKPPKYILWFKDYYEINYNRFISDMEASYPEKKGFFAVIGRRWSRGRLEPMWNKRIFFKEGKQILKRARKSPDTSVYFRIEQ